MATSQWYIFNIHHKDTRQLNRVRNVIRDKFQSLNVQKPILMREYGDESHLRVGFLSPSSPLKDAFMSFLRELQDHGEIDHFDATPSKEHDEADHAVALAYECVEIRSELFKTVSKAAYFFHNYLNQDGAVYIDQVQNEAIRFLKEDPERYEKVRGYLVEMNEVSHLLSHVWRSASGVVN